MPLATLNIFLFLFFLFFVFVFVHINKRERESPGRTIASLAELIEKSLASASYHSKSDDASEELETGQKRGDLSEQGEPEKGPTNSSDGVPRDYDGAVFSPKKVFLFVVRGSPIRVGGGMQAGEEEEEEEKGKENDMEVCEVSGLGIVVLFFCFGGARVWGGGGGTGRGTGVSQGYCCCVYFVFCRPSLRFVFYLYI